jgi:4-coumarate--CoA ligase
VAPAEIESVLLSHEGIADALVIPVPCEEAGEVPRAYVVRQQSWGVVSEEELHNLIQDRLSPHKRLRGGIRFVESVPRAVSGKLLRRKQIELDRGS